MMHGIAIKGDTVYLATVTELYRAEMLADGTLGPLERIIDDLPAGGQHPNRMIRRPGRQALPLGRFDPQRLRRDRSGARDDPPGRAPTDRRARSSRRACAIRSATASTRKPASSTAWTTASTGSVTASKARS
jgi:hypothetical protein